MNLHLFHYFTIVMCMLSVSCASVCLCVCLSVCEHISGTARPIFTDILCMLNCGRDSILAPFRMRCVIGDVADTGLQFPIYSPNTKSALVVLLGTALNCISFILFNKSLILDTIRYDTRCYFNVRSKADISQLNLPHGTDN